MSVKRIGGFSRKQLLLLCGLSGMCSLCLAVSPNNIIPPEIGVSTFRMTQDLLVRIVRKVPADSTAVPALPPVPNITPAFLKTPVTLIAVAPVYNATVAPGRVRMALLLPLRSPALRGAAEMVRDGFRAAHERDGANVDVKIIETDDNPQNIAAAYRDAVDSHDILIGPLSRSGVAAVAMAGNVSRPTIALGLPEPVGDTDVMLPPKMLVMGLSIEEEARQTADWAARLQPAAKALVLSTGVAWQRRAARAFVGQWQRGAASADTLELGAAGSQLSTTALSALKKRLDGTPPDLIFVALDAAQSRQLRLAIGPRIAFYGTSQLNAMSLADAGAEPRPELDGIRLLDLPWQLQADHPAVMIYPHPVPKGEQRRSADFERLYALGIDAFRVAGEISAGRPVFTIDGVTGKLYVQFDGIRPATFARIEQTARYSGGVAAPVIDGR